MWWINNDFSHELELSVIIELQTRSTLSLLQERPTLLLLCLTVAVTQSWLDSLHHGGTLEETGGGEIPCIVPLSTQPTLKYLLFRFYLFALDFTKILEIPNRKQEHEHKYQLLAVENNRKHRAVKVHGDLTLYSHAVTQILLLPCMSHTNQIILVVFRATWSYDLHTLIGWKNRMSNAKNIPGSGCLQGWRWWALSSSPSGCRSGITCPSV